MFSASTTTDTRSTLSPFGSAEFTPITGYTPIVEVTATGMTGGSTPIGMAPPISMTPIDMTPKLDGKTDITAKSTAPPLTGTKDIVAEPTETPEVVAAKAAVIKAEEDKKTKKTIWIVVGIAIVAVLSFLGYKYFTGKKGTAPVA